PPGGAVGRPPTRPRRRPAPPPGRPPGPPGGHGAAGPPPTAVIHALSIGGSLSGTFGSGSTNLNLSGAGAGSGNFVYNTVESYIGTRLLFITTAACIVRQLNE